METNYKRTVAGSIGAGMAAVFNASGRQYYILEHKTESLYHHAGESQKIIVDQVELGRDSSCQVRFDESFETVSRRHAAIVKDGEGWKLINLSQTNPTFVNGQPIQGEWKLNSGDEIRLSSRGPLMGFIVPQGKQSLVSSIGLTERMNLFRQQALRPYKRAIWALAIILLLAVAGLVTWNILQGKAYNKQLEQKQEQIEKVQEEIKASDDLIDNLKIQMIKTKDADRAEKARIKAELQKAQEERNQLDAEKAQLQDDVYDLQLKAIKDEQEKAAERARLEEQKKKEAEEAARQAREREVSIEELINSQRKSDPNIF